MHTKRVMWFLAVPIVALGAAAGLRAQGWVRLVAETGDGDPLAAMAAAPATGPLPASGPASPDAVTDRAYNKDFWNGRFGFHILNNFPGFTVVNPSATESIFATDFDPTATTLYYLDSGALQLGTYNLATGARTVIGSSVPTAAGHTNWSGMAIDPVTGVIYAAAIAGAVNVPYGLYTINPATGAPTLVGQDADVPGMIAIAMNCEGELYGHEIIGDSIYQINPANGEATLVGPTGVAANFAQGMDFDNTSGVLYAWIYTGSGGNQYGTIDLGTGDLTPLSTNNPIGEYEGAIQTQCFIFRDGFEAGNTDLWDVP